jgi:hypothetical protein
MTDDGARARSRAQYDDGSRLDDRQAHDHAGARVVAGHDAVRERYRAGYGYDGRDNRHTAPVAP